MFIVPQIVLRVCRFGKHKGGHSAARVVSRVLRQLF